ncbi:MAG: hypothetical protein ACI9KN_001912 [Gammaproteobacteria bacterium]|jgi:hypothetical protein
MGRGLTWDSYYRRHPVLFQETNSNQHTWLRVNYCMSYVQNDHLKRKPGTAFSALEFKNNIDACPFFRPFTGE